MSGRAPHRSAFPIKWRDQGRPTERIVPAETAIAITCNGTTHAVMMATPEHLEDFAVGFALSEGLIADRSEIERFEVHEHLDGLEARMWLEPSRANELFRRSRKRAGPTGCGLCGIESLQEANRNVPRVDADLTVNPQDIMLAMQALSGAQELHRRTRAVHGAGYWTQSGGLLAIREDVGRHNALDKLIGALGAGLIEPGLCLLTSRISIDMVQKAAMARFPVVVAVSAPTDAALNLAERANITIVAVARRDGFEVFTHPRRVDTGISASRHAHHASSSMIFT